MKVTIIIPSLNPDQKLIQVVDSLIEKGFEDILLVNDGSDENHMEPFQRIEKIPQCHILHHEVNKGKGRALKTAFAWCEENRPDIDGVITVDGDNQHKADDIFACGLKMVEQKNHLILGVRDFSGEEVPGKSRFGNRITSFVFKSACGLNITDTQTGLRAIPRQYLKIMCGIKGERFEYETNMLLELKSHSIPFTEVKIETVYIEENASTHFHPVWDSLKIYGVIFKFLLGSVMSSIIDLAVFSLLMFILYEYWDKSRAIFAATVGARVVSSLFNYTFNRKAVFGYGSSIRRSLVKYYILCVCQMLVSYGLVYGLTVLLHVGGGLEVLVKLVVDTFLFCISFVIQRAWVFR